MINKSLLLLIARFLDTTVLIQTVRLKSVTTTLLYRLQIFEMYPRSKTSDYITTATVPVETLLVDGPARKIPSAPEEEFEDEEDTPGLLLMLGSFLFLVVPFLESFLLKLLMYYIRFAILLISGTIRTT